MILALAVKAMHAAQNDKPVFVLKMAEKEEFPYFLDLHPQSK